MTYKKPEIAVLGSAKVLIQAVKTKRIETNGLQPGTLP